MAPNEEIETTDAVQDAAASERLCRICHAGVSSGKRLLSPCHCSGSMKFVHQHCLQRWILNATNRGKTSCELCGFLYAKRKGRKPFREWKAPKLTTRQKENLCLAVGFQALGLLSIVCVAIHVRCSFEYYNWNEIKLTDIEWPFWIYTVAYMIMVPSVIAISYIKWKLIGQCLRQWRDTNSDVYVLDAPEHQRKSEDHTDKGRSATISATDITWVDIPLEYSDGEASIGVDRAGRPDIVVSNGPGRVGSEGGQRSTQRLVEEFIEKYCRYKKEIPNADLTRSVPTSGFSLDRSELNGRSRSDLEQDSRSDLKQDSRSDLKQDSMNDLNQDSRSDLKQDSMNDLNQDSRSDLKQDSRGDLKEESICCPEQGSSNDLKQVVTDLDQILTDVGLELPGCLLKCQIRHGNGTVNQICLSSHKDHDNKRVFTVVSPDTLPTTKSKKIKCSKSSKANNALARMFAVNVHQVYTDKQ